MLDTTWEQPPFDIVRFAHLELVVTDLAAAREFYVDLLGLVVSEETEDALYLRGYEERLHHSLVLRRGPARRPSPGSAPAGHFGSRIRSASRSSSSTRCGPPSD